MRTHVGIAAAVIAALGFVLPVSAAPITIVKQNTPQATPSFLTPLSLPSFLKFGNKFSSYYPSMPNISHPNGRVAINQPPLTNGQPNADYFKLFGMKFAPRLR